MVSSFPEKMLRVLDFLCRSKTRITSFPARWISQRGKWGSAYTLNDCWEVSDATYSWLMPLPSCIRMAHRHWRSCQTTVLYKRGSLSKIAPVLPHGSGGKVVPNWTVEAFDPHSYRRGYLQTFPRATIRCRPLRGFLWRPGRSRFVCGLLEGQWGLEPRWVAAHLHLGDPLDPAVAAMAWCDESHREAVPGGELLVSDVGGQ
jgi:hypothetical protein